MLSKFRSRLSYSNVIATIALFSALGGGAYAASKIPKNSVGTAQLKSNAVISSKVKNRSLLAVDFKAGQLPKGPKGDQGIQGLKGDKGDKGDTGTVNTSNFYTKSQSDSNFVAKDSSGVVNVPTTNPPNTTVLTHGTVTFSATCTDENNGPPDNEFRLKVFAQSSEANSRLGLSNASTDVNLSDVDPAELQNTVTSIFAVRQMSGAVVTPTQAFNVLVTGGVNRGGANNCFAGVTVLP
jgi:hypothetical protein